MLSTSVNSDLFQCVETGALENLDNFCQTDFRPFLPILVRSGLIQAGDIFGRPLEFRHGILVELSDLEAVNAVVALLSVDFQVLEGDVKKELQLRQKFGSRDQDSVLVQSLKDGLALEYERSDSTRRLRLVLSEILYIMSQIHEMRPEYYMKASDIFDNWVYLEEVCDAICIALVELPNILSLSEVCEAMLHVRHGPWIICRLIANMPDSFLEVCFHLISNGDKCEEDTEGGRIRLDALRALCRMNPRQSLLVRSRCVEQCRMPALTIFLSLEIEDVEVNLIPFLSGILLGNDQQIRNWFTLYIRNSQKRKCDSTNSVLKMREAIWAYLKKILNDTRQKCLNESTVVQGSSLLRLACAMKGIAGFKFYDDEIGDLVGLITLKAPSSPPGYRFVTLGLCTLLACPTLISTTEQEKVVIEWIKSLLLEETSLSNVGVTSSFGEILLLMAIHFHSNQLSAIADLVCTTLGMKIAIRINTMTRIKQIFTQEIFTEQVVTAHAVRVPVTANLNADISGFLPVHCIYQLIKSRAFTKHRVPIKDWIYRQLTSTKLPLHPVLPALLEVYTHSVLVPSSGTMVGGAKVLLELTNEPLSDEEILSTFKDFQTKNMAPQLLILYYLLLYEDNRQMNCRTLLAQGKKIKLYSAKLFSQIPIKFLLQESQKSQHQCGGLFPSLLKLLTTHFPQLCIMNEWIDESVMLSKVDTQLQMCFHRNLLTSVGEGDIRKAFMNCTESPRDAIKIMETLFMMEPNKLWPHAKEIVEQIQIVIQSSVPRKIQDLFRDVWYQLNNVFPRHLWEMTSNALLPQNSVYLSVEELTMDPLQILKCDEQVFRCAPVLNILLHILAASLASSKYFLTKHLIENPMPNTFGGGNSDIEREELKLAVIASQDSAAVQMLLEACLPSEEEKNEISSNLCLKEIQSLVCSFLHQMFIADPNLAKLVHFQGYPLELLPVTVRGIPSMHICSDFIPELLNQPETSKQVFAVQLISHLSMQYALPKSYNIARMALATMSAMASGVVSEGRAEFFIPVLTALERLSEAFPPLVDEIVTLLMHLGKVCTAQNSVERNRMSKIVRNKLLLKRVHETYDVILKHSMLDRKIF